ncbi:hypothetical protein [Campylobacter corcagiensis]|uniref:Uncharacterized protein n=1 Tax=Campylobacter corcagiensis TaxID=1448857 RepID=A0A7M1LI74_9BACT|nr:hypothetical protein [Campylobacter corcagiensis]QKF64130.1 putative membrane protein [Campylobacter corcagiensis]QOQ87674.1 hypothetical protein IMC76_02350 [Campylobacter corcagiensis]
MLLIAGFLVCEILGIYLNRGDNFGEILNSYTKRWQKSKVLFFATEFSFIYLNFIVFGLNLTNFLTISLYLLYATDLFYRVYLCDKFSKNELNYEMKFMLNISISVKSRLLISISMAIALSMAL